MKLIGKVLKDYLMAIALVVFVEACFALATGVKASYQEIFFIATVVTIIWQTRECILAHIRPVETADEGSTEEIGKSESVIKGMSKEQLYRQAKREDKNG